MTLLKRKIQGKKPFQKTRALPTMPWAEGSFACTMAIHLLVSFHFLNWDLGNYNAKL